MKIFGLVKTSTVDYPSKLVSTIFLGGCNLDCHYCQNRELINPPKNMKEISIKELLKHLDNRKDIIEGLCISGGEPSIHNDKLVELVKNIKKNMGDSFFIKLDTNGTNPEFLKKNMDLFDFIAMDYKSLNYEKDLDFSSGKIKESLEVLKTYKKDYEIRITVYPEYIKVTDFIDLANSLIGIKKVAIQQYKPVEYGVEETYSPSVLYELKKLIEDNKIECELRC